jgi:hypothetical protein
MKNTTLSIIVLLFVSLCFGQQIQYNIGFETTDNDGVINYWRTFESPNPIAQIIDNPDTDGGTVPVTKVMQLDVDQNSACYAGVINQHGTLGTWVLDASVPSNLTLSVDINSSLSQGRVGVKMVNATDGTVFEISDAQGDYSGAGQWQTLTWNIASGASSGDNINIDQIVVFADWRCDGGVSPRPSNVTLLIDNISWGANKLSDPPAPSCSNGLEDGDETGVDCGGSCPNSCIPDPPTSAPQFGSTGTDLYVYSELQGPSVTNFIFNSFGGSGAYSEIDIEADGNLTGKLFNLDFFGSQWNPVDTTPYTYVHLDYYATTSSQFEFFLIDDSLSQTVCCGNPAEPFYGFGPSADEPLVQGQWVSVFIPLSHFSNFNSGWDGTDIKQTKFTGNGTVYFDNIYFTTENALSTETFNPNSISVYPNPTRDFWHIEALNSEITKIEVFDILGKKIKSIEPSNSEALVDSSELNTGVYFATIETKIGKSVLRLIKN